jgi:penicillin-binding protein 2
LKTDSFLSLTRESVAYFVIIASVALLGFRLVQMQIIEYGAYNEKATNNAIKGIEQIPLRGVFYDRNMNVLVSNVPAYTVRITPAEYDTSLSKLLEAILDFEPGSINKILLGNRTYSKFVPIRIKRGIDFNAVSWLQENSSNLPGVDLLVEMQRGYPAGIRGSHMFGYTKEISPALLEKDKDYYKPGDLIGSSGVEKAYEKIIRGKKGYTYVLVDSRRKEIGRFKNGSEDVVSIKGNDLVLGIDSDVQKVAETELVGKDGSAVAIDPKTGEILAYASAPDYDLNEFSYSTSRDYLQKLYTNPDKPMFNRVNSSPKPPGSTFKVMESVAALDMGVIGTDYTVVCRGGQVFGGRFFKCDGTHGALNVVHAIERSCDVFFYNLIYKIGMEKWYEYARRFGFGQTTHIDIGEESPGFIPTEAHYEKIYGENWPRSIMASLGIGQGEVNVTPIQLAQYVALLANDGVTYTPHVVKGYLSNDSSRKYIPFSYKEVNVGISKNVFAIAKEGMFLVVNGNGTAVASRSADVQIAGKTGTAQNPHGKDHALFIGYAPADNPQIAVAVVLENVGFGATWAAPIAKKMIEAYLLKDKLKQQKIDNDKKLSNNLTGVAVAH